MNWRLAAMKNGLLDSIAYRFEFALDLLGSALVPLVIQVLIWRTLFTDDPGRTLAGRSYHDLMAYTLGSVLFSQVRGGNLDFEIAEMIRTGQLSNYLLRPVSVIQFVYFRGLGQKSFVMLLCTLMGFAWLGLSGGSPARLLGGMFLAFLGNVIAYQLSIAAATAAFYWEEAWSVLLVKNMIVALLSGEMFPLYLVPERYAWIWKATPFYVFVYGPTQYTVGAWSHVEFMNAIGISLLWIVMGGLLLKGCWKVGMRQYLSLGG